jgi:hypothetical protein
MRESQPLAVCVRHQRYIDKWAYPPVQRECFLDDAGRK